MEKQAVTNSGVEITSSTPAPIPPRQKALFRAVLTLLENARQPYAVAGAFALQQHTGICRFTKDLDIFLSAAAASDALVCLQEHGFECEVCDPIWLAKAHRDGFFVDFITGMSNGVISVDSSWIERAIPATILGINTRVLAPEELLASKLFVTRRERFDGADIAHIIFASRGKLQWDRVLQLVGEHWELLLWSLILFRYVYPAHSGYVPTSLWRELLSRLNEELEAPHPNPRFRGSLIDPVMFAIDVEEWGLDDVLKEMQALGMKIKPPPDTRRVRLPRKRE